MTRLDLCPIWNSNAATVEKYEASGFFDNPTNVWHVDNSPRSAGGFVLPDMLHRSELLLMSEEQKAWLTTWLIDQRNQEMNSRQSLKTLLITSRTSRHFLFTSGQTDSYDIWGIRLA